MDCSKGRKYNMHFHLWILQTCPYMHHSYDVKYPRETKVFISCNGWRCISWFLEGHRSWPYILLNETIFMCLYCTLVPPVSPGIFSDWYSKINPFPPSVPIWHRVTRLSILILEGVFKKISYERRDYESVDEKSLS